MFTKDRPITLLDVEDILRNAINIAAGRTVRDIRGVPSYKTMDYFPKNNTFLVTVKRQDVIHMQIGTSDIAEAITAYNKA